MLPLIAFGPLCILKELPDDRGELELRDQVKRQNNRRLFMFQMLAFYCSLAKPVLRWSTT